MNDYAYIVEVIEEFDDLDQILDGQKFFVLPFSLLETTGVGISEYNSPKDKVVDDFTPSAVIKAVVKAGVFRQGGLVNLSQSDISRILGFEPNVEDDPDKVLYSYGFTYNGIHCGIWDYYESSNDRKWSFYGPKEIFVKLFGADHVEV